MASEPNNTNDVAPQSASGATRVGPVAALVIGVFVLVAAGVGLVAVIGMDWYGRQGDKLPQTFTPDDDAFEDVDPELIKYRELEPIPVEMKQVRAIAVGPEDGIYVAGDQKVRAFDRDGQPRSEIALETEPTCLAVGGGRIYVGGGQQVELFDPNGDRVGVWKEEFNERSVLTSIAVGEEDDVYVADAGNRVVLRFDVNGELLAQIGKPDPERHVPGFVIIRPYLDTVVTPDGLLRAVNPGACRIEAYTPEGDPMGHWGEGSSKLDGFYGCCNPAHLAVLPDGRFVTSEKGLPRVKVYSKTGEFQCVVVDPKSLAGSPGGKSATTSYDLAVDSKGRVLVLDPKSRSVRVFVEKETR